MNSLESGKIYARRKTRVEHPFGHRKRNPGMANFLLRGREGAHAEISIAAPCFNVVRMITLLGGVKEPALMKMGTHGASSSHYKAHSSTNMLLFIHLV